MRTRWLPFVTIAALAGCAADDSLPLETDTTTQEIITERNATIAAGASHSCAVQGNGTVQCWGRNHHGQLGNGSLLDSAAPVTVTGITTAQMVTAGDYHTCAVLANGTARCWGNNSSGQLGNGGTTSAANPVVVNGLGGTVTSISAGGTHTCASLADGTARCWGKNTYGQLGNNALVDSPTPRTVLASATVAMTGVAEVEAGKSSTCARLSSGYVRCWGRNQYGQLGNGTYDQRTIGVYVTGISSATELAVGDYHACAVLSTGRARCWGYNFMGQLGDGTQNGRPAPVEVKRLAGSVVSPLAGVSAAAAGFGHTCLRSNGEVWCMGRNDDRQAGVDPSGYLELYAVRSSPLVHAEQLAAGGDHTCARRPGGAVVCFGKDGHGQTGAYPLCPAQPTAAVVSVTTPSTWPYLARQLHKEDASGDIYYTNGDRIDLKIETTGCAAIHEVVFRGLSSIDDPIEPGDSFQYQTLSTVDRADGVREIAIRIPWTNYHRGHSFPVTVTLASPAGNRATTTPFTVAEVLSVNSSSGTIHLTQEEVMNEVMKALYEKWGDGNRYVRNGVDLYALDYANFKLEMKATGISFEAKVRADLIEGFDDSDLCNPWATATGELRVILDGDQIKTAWNVYPEIDTEFPIGCQIVGGFVLDDLIDLIVDIAFNDNIAARVEKRIEGLRDHCSILGCSAVLESITHQVGYVEVKLKKVLDFDNVTFLDAYADGLLGGIAIPTNEGTIVVAGGVAGACALQTGPCETRAFSAAGLFNWNWPAIQNPYLPDDGNPHPPIPDPWPDCPGETCPYYAGRHGPWLRQVGLRRDLAAIHMPAHNPGSLVARLRFADGTTGPVKNIGELCGLEQASGSVAARLAIARNEVPGGPFNYEYGTGDAIVTINFTNIGNVALACPE